MQNDLAIIQSLPKKITVINDTQSSNAVNLAKINSKGQATYFEVTDLPYMPQVFCLVNLQRLSLHSDVLGGSEWYLPNEIGELTKLTQLTISNIGGTHWPEALGKLKSLNNLWLSGKDLKEVPCGLAALSDLYTLHIDAPLEEFPSFLSVLTLTQLVLSERSKFSSIPDGFFQYLNPTLIDLSLSVSNAQALEPLADLTRLPSLRISVDQLASFPWPLTHMKSLTKLELTVGSSCGISTLPQNFSKTLDYLIFRSCLFKEIPIQIALSKNLTWLDMSQNRIVDMAAITLTKSPLRYLQLSSNQIETIPKEISYLSETLGSLGLYGNKLTTVPAEVLVKMKKLTYLSLVYNPIQADEIQRLKKIFATNPKLTVIFWSCCASFF